MKRLLSLWAVAGAMFSLLLLLGNYTTAAADAPAIYNFNRPNGIITDASLIQGRDGSFYGTTVFGGNSYGTVFKLTTDGTAAGTTVTTLVNFNIYTNGAYPNSALIQGRDGSFYGTTGGDGGSDPTSAGTVFKLTTDGTAAGTTLTTLVNFSGTDEELPYASLIQGRDGSFYGTTYRGGYGGTVFKVTTDGTAAGTTLTTLVKFNGTNGANPQAALIQASDGSFYGTTYQGGDSGHGTVFKVTTDGTAAGTTLTTLVNFNGTNGTNTYGSLVQASDGSFYGTTIGDGSSGPTGNGTVFKVTTDGIAAGTTLRTLVSFNGTNGANPTASLIQGRDGSFYGTTYNGGSSGLGTAFKLTTDGTAAGTTLRTLVNFNYANGAYPVASLIQGRDRKFYGTTYYGGSKGYGTVFVIDPRAIQSVAFTPMTLASNTSAIGEVTLSHIATTNQVVTLTSSNPAVLPIRSSVTITVGHRHALFTVSAKTVTTLTTVTITATLNGVSQYSTVQVTP